MVQRRMRIQRSARRPDPAAPDRTPPGQGRPRHRAGRPARAPRAREADRHAARADDARREGRPDDAARPDVPRDAGGRREPITWARCCPAATPTPKAGNSLRRLARDDRRLPRADAAVAPQDPAALRRRRRPRPQQRRSARSSSRTTSGSGRRATRSSSRRSRRITAQEVRATGANWTFAPCVDRAARRALGPELRGLRRGPLAREGARRGRRARLPGRGPYGPLARRGLRQALRRRRRHDLGHRHEGRLGQPPHRPGRNAGRRGHARARSTSRRTPTRSRRASRRSCRPTRAGTA